MKNRFTRNKLNKINPIEGEYGNITIKKSKKKELLRTACKLFGVVFISSMLGTFLSVYIITSNYMDSIIERINPNINTSNIVKEVEHYMGKVIQNIAPSIVTIGSSENNLEKRDSDNDNLSGVILRTDGYILTSWRGIKSYKNIYVKLPSAGTKPFLATIVGGDELTDLAMIKIEADDLPEAKFVDVDDLHVGEKVISVGNSTSDDYVGMVTSGMITSLNKKIRLTEDNIVEGHVYDVIETDTIINNGNNGGALCTYNGEIVGINSMFLHEKYSKDGLNYTLTSKEIQKVIESILSYKVVEKVSLGIEGATLITEDSQDISGVYVEKVIKESGADKAGLKPTDIIIELDNKNIRRVEDIVDVLNNHFKGDVINCKIIREEKEIDISITLQ